MSRKSKHPFRPQNILLGVFACIEDFGQRAGVMTLTSHNWIDVNSWDEARCRQFKQQVRILAVLVSKEPSWRALLEESRRSGANMANTIRLLAESRLGNAILANGPNFGSLLDGERHVD